jgi:phosphatidate cytidylyltransferase
MPFAAASGVSDAPARNCAPRPAAEGAGVVIQGLEQRVITALILAPFAVALVLLPDTAAFALMLAAVFAFGLGEWARLIGLRSFASRAALVLASIAMMAALWEARAHPIFGHVVVVGALWWSVAALWLRHFEFGASERRRNAGIKAAAGVLTVVPAWAAAITLHALPERGPWWVLFVLVLIWSADIAAYFVGRRYGRVKLAPRISPGKTRAGVYGALIGSATYAAIAGRALGEENLALLLLVALSLVTVLFSIVGDLFESLIKRHSNLKDSGSVLPGHGGVFDRLDSLFAALPIFAAGKLLLGL